MSSRVTKYFLSWQKIICEMFSCDEKNILLKYFLHHECWNMKFIMTCWQHNMCGLFRHASQMRRLTFGHSNKVLRHRVLASMQVAWHVIVRSCTFEPTQGGPLCAQRVSLVKRHTTVWSFQETLCKTEHISRKHKKQTGTRNLKQRQQQQKKKEQNN